MKIPLYKRQIERSAKPAGLVSNISVNTAAWMAPGQAVAQVGDAVQKWAYEKAELAAKTDAYNALNNLNDQLTTKSRALLKSNDPGEADKTAERDLRRIYTNVLNNKNLSTRARTLLRSTADTTFRTALSGFRTKNDARILKFNQNRITENISSLTLKASDPDSSPVMRLQALNELFGGETYPGVFKSTDMTTLFTPKQIKNYKSVAEERIFKDRLTNLIEKNPPTSSEQLDKLINNSGTLTALSKRLGPEKVQSLKTKLYEKSVELNDKILEREEKNDKRLVTQRKRRQENNFDLYNSQIDTMRSASPDDDVDRISLKELQTFKKERKINPTQFETLRKKLTGQDVVTNLAYVNEKSDDIENSFTEVDLDFHEEQIRLARDNGTIGQKAYEQLNKKIFQYRTKVPEIADIKTNRQNLKAALSPPTGLMGAFTDSSLKNTPEIMAVSFYDEMVGRGVRPQEAFLRALSNYGVDKEKIVLNVAKKMDSRLLKSLGWNGTSQIDENFIKKITDNNVKSAQEQLDKMAYGTMQVPSVVLDKDFRVGPSDQLTTEELTKQQFGVEEDKRITKRQRISVRKLYQMEVELDVIRELVKERKIRASEAKKGDKKKDAASRAKGQ